MEISDVRVKLIMVPEDRLKAVCSVTFDEVFVVRDVKVVDGTNGLFVAMPSRKLSMHCPRCKQKNHIKARYCNECGGQLPPQRATDDAGGRGRLHRDLAHPVSIEFREELQRRVIEAFEQEMDRSRDPNYRPRDIDAEQVEAATEAVDTPEPVRGGEREMSEYDAIIAGLKSGTLGPREPSRPTSRGQDDSAHRSRGNATVGRDQVSRRPPRVPDRTGAGRESGSRRGERTPAQSDQGTRRGGEPARSNGNSRETRRDQRSERPPMRRADDAPVEKSANAAKTTATPTPPAPERRPSPPPTPQRPAPAPPKPSQPPSEDDTGFGAGLF